VKLLVSEGVLVPTAEVTAESLNVGTDSGADGHIRRVQFETRAVPAEMQASFIGKKPGESVVNNGVTLTVTEVYSIDKVAAAAYQAKQAQQQAAPLPVDEATQKAIDESGDSVSGNAKFGEATGTRNDPGAPPAGASSEQTADAPQA
jgi:hypothetical protein